MFDDDENLVEGDCDRVVFHHGGKHPHRSETLSLRDTMGSVGSER